MKQINSNILNISKAGRMRGVVIKHTQRYLRVKSNPLFIFMLFSGLLFLSSCGNTASKEIPAGEVKEVLPENIVELNIDQYKMAGVTMGTVELRTLSNLIKINGLISAPPQNIATVSTPMGGFIKSTSLMQGSVIKKGQILAMVENPDFIDLQQNYLEGRNQLEYVEADYNRQKDLYKDNISSAKSFQQITSEYKILKGKVSALGQKLSLIGLNPTSLTETNIKRAIPVISPISGFVKQVNVNIGKYVSPTDVLFEIVNTTKLTVELTVFEKDIHEISIGQKLRFGLSDEGKDQYSAVIYQVGKILQADKTVKIYATITNPSARLIPGIYVTASVETQDNSMTALPSEAIVQFDEKDYIFIFDRVKQENGKKITEYKMVQVKRGDSDNGYTGVVLPAGFDVKNAKVVIKGAYNLMAAKKNAGDMAC
jgi:cobalt-zinc-cadmium efflux system membrane fusion protein